MPGSLPILTIFLRLKKATCSTARFAEKSVDNLLEAIETSRNVPLDRFLVSLSIPQVGEETAHDVALHFGKLEKCDECHS